MRIECTSLWAMERTKCTAKTEMCRDCCGQHDLCVCVSLMFSLRCAFHTFIIHAPFTFAFNIQYETLFLFSVLFSFVCCICTFFICVLNYSSLIRSQQFIWNFQFHSRFLFYFCLVSNNLFALSCVCLGKTPCFFLFVRRCLFVYSFLFSNEPDASFSALSCSSSKFRKSVKSIGVCVGW